MPCRNVALAMYGKYNLHRFSQGLVLPKGPSAPESSQYFWRLHRHQWGNIHFHLSIAFTVFVIIHLILSWSWIKGKARSLFKKGKKYRLEDFCWFRWFLNICLEDQITVLLSAFNNYTYPNSY